MRTTCAKLLLSAGLLAIMAWIAASPPGATDRSSGEIRQIAGAGRYHAVRRRGALYDRSLPTRPSRGLYTVRR